MPEKLAEEEDTCTSGSWTMTWPTAGSPCKRTADKQSAVAEWSTGSDKLFPSALAGCTSDRTSLEQLKKGTP